MELNSKVDEQIKQCEEFIKRVEGDIININGIPTSKFENIDPNSTGFCNCALPALTNIIY